MKKLIAKYKCLKCNHEFNDKPGLVECPKCGYLYIKWLNYEELFGKNGEIRKISKKNSCP